VCFFSLLFLSKDNDFDLRIFKLFSDFLFLCFSFLFLDPFYFVSSLFFFSSACPMLFVILLSFFFCFVTESLVVVSTVKSFWVGGLGHLRGA